MDSWWTPLETRDELELACVVERGRLEPRDEEGREPLDQQLVVVPLARRHLREELQRIGARERIGKRAHDEVQPPRELLPREVRQRAQERLLEAADHLGVLVGKERADE